MLRRSEHHIIDSTSYELGQQEWQNVIRFAWPTYTGSLKISGRYHVTGVSGNNKFSLKHY